METKSAYLVTGYTGEYEDAIEWPVIVYFDEVKASEHAYKARVRALELESWRSDDDRSWDYVHRREDKPCNEYDPEMEMGYGGVFYSVSKVPVCEAE